MNKIVLMKKIEDELTNFKKSPLFKYRMENKFFPVIGEGSVDSKIMFIGEAPGKKEALTGRPFCGASGKLLDSLLESVGIKRADVYITNIVKDRPKDNPDPSSEEIKLYGLFLEEKIEPIGQAHGKSYETNFSYGKVKIISLYHPAVALYNGGMRETLKNDFKILKDL